MSSSLDGGASEFEHTMPVYMVIEITVEDAQTYAEYMERVPATIEKYGGRYLVRGGPVSLDPW